VAGALHHVIARGIERGRIFKDDQDRYSFLSRLGTILQETETACYAWAQIPNHFHLLLRTGAVPLASVMRRLMTGHAISFNRRHGRCGHLFQNRYKSVLCQEDAYFLELVRYIHLNPLRAGLVKNLTQLEKYPFSGHSVIMGKYRQDWHRSGEVLSYFGKQAGAGRKRYRDFVGKGVAQGRRPDLTGGGLVRSSGGWGAVNKMRKSGTRVKSDERILGDSDFVSRVLSDADEAFDRKYELKARGMDIDRISARVASLLEMAEDEVCARGRYQHIVTARSLICYLAVRELGTPMISLAGRFGISTAAVSKSVERGGRIIKTQGYDVNNLIS
jgi:REP element-mobilizing transposase RayT